MHLDSDNSLERAFFAVFTPMTLYEFNALSDDSQADYWIAEGRYLVQRYEDEYRIGLYAVDSFFVEAWYDPVSNELDWLRSFSSVKALDNYLPYIQVEW